MLDLSTTSLILVVVGLYIGYSVLQVIIDPLRDIPGPFLARFTRLWYLREVYKGSFEFTNIDLHKNYGPIVRISPNEYSIDDLNAAKTIYGHGTEFAKVGPRNSPVYHIKVISLTITRLRGTGLGGRQMQIKLHCLRAGILTATGCNDGSTHRPLA